MQTELYVIFGRGMYVAYGSPGYHLVSNPQLASVFTSEKEASYWKDYCVEFGIVDKAVIKRWQITEEDL